MYDAAEREIAEKKRGQTPRHMTPRDRDIMTKLEEQEKAARLREAMARDETENGSDDGRKDPKFPNKKKKKRDENETQGDDRDHAETDHEDQSEGSGSGSDSDEETDSGSNNGVNDEGKDEDKIASPNSDAANRVPAVQNLGTQFAEAVRKRHEEMNVRRDSFRSSNGPASERVQTSSRVDLARDLSSGTTKSGSNRSLSRGMPASKNVLAEGSWDYQLDEMQRRKIFSEQELSGMNVGLPHTLPSLPGFVASRRLVVLPMLCLPPSRI